VSAVLDTPALDTPDVETIGLEQIETSPNDERIIVLVDMPHLAEWGYDTSRELVYRYRLPDPIAVGDAVVCPPSPLSRGEEFTGIVLSLDASAHPYKGPARDVLRKVGG
jgi:hypothetical protein